MARDYRHGHSNKKGFTRKSQQTSHQLEKRSVSLIWGAGFLVSAVFLIGFLSLSILFPKVRNRPCQLKKPFFSLPSTCKK